VPLCVVTRAYQRAAFDVQQAACQPFLAVLGEEVGVDVLGYLEVHFGGLEVLPYGQDVAAMRHQLIHRFEHLVAGFAEADHDARFGAFAVVFDALDLLQTALPFGLGAHFAVQARHGFHVVADHFLARRYHALEGFPVGLDIGYERFDGGVGAALLDCPHGLVPHFGTSVFEFVAVDGGDDRVLDPHEPDGFGHAPRFVFVVLVGAAGLDGTKRTRTRTHIAQNHKRSGTSPPAFAHVGAVAALADGVQLKIIDDTPHVAVVLAHREADFEPLGSLGARGRSRCIDYRKFDHIFFKQKKEGATLGEPAPQKFNAKLRQR
jgi:hypothetical protein